METLPEIHPRIEINVFWLRPCQGRRPRGTGGRSPKLWSGDGPCIRPPNILRSSLVGWALKYEQSKKDSVIKEFFSGFSCEERVIYDI